MAYKIDVKAVAEYIDYLKKFKKNSKNSHMDIIEMYMLMKKQIIPFPVM